MNWLVVLVLLLAVYVAYATLTVITIAGLLRADPPLIVRKYVPDGTVVLTRAQWVVFWVRAFVLWPLFITRVRSLDRAYDDLGD